MITFNLPTQLLALCGGQKSIQVEATTLGEAFRGLDEAAPMIRSQLFDAAGELRQFIGLFLDNQHVLTLGDGAQSVQSGSRIDIVMAVAGG